jgi:hypothetical protein
MLDCINRRRDERIQVENALLQYKIQALQVKVSASRAQLLSQFAQDVRFTRAKYMELVGQQYYQIQRDRRLAETKLPGEYFFFFTYSRKMEANGLQIPSPNFLRGGPSKLRSKRRTTWKYLFCRASPNMLDFLLHPPWREPRQRMSLGT